jgi:hypothetical protein
MDHHGLPQGPHVVYNVIMPTGSLESDFFGLHKLCIGKDAPTAWHFHQTPYTREVIAAIVTAGLNVLSVSTGGIPAALGDLLTAFELVEQPGPIYTISFADPACKPNLIQNLAHEMVEAASDPFPSTSVILSGDGEAVDICDKRNAAASSPFVPPGTVLPPREPFPPFARFTTAGTISVPQYWSNAGQKCITGFADSTAPTGPGGGPIRAAITGNGADITFTITGSGFGLLPSTPPGRPPWSVNFPYIAIQDETQGWQAGNSLNSDFVRLNVASWADTGVVIDGFFFLLGNLVMQPGDHLSYWLCNPASGKCASGNVGLVESGSPQLKVFINNTRDVNLSYDLLIDGVKAAGPLFNDTSSAWLSFTDSPTVTVGENSLEPGFFAPRFINGGCDASGRVSLKPGRQPDLPDPQHRDERLRCRPALLLRQQLRRRLHRRLRCRPGPMQTALCAEQKMLLRAGAQRSVQRPLHRVGSVMRLSMAFGRTRGRQMRPVSRFSREARA